MRTDTWSYQSPVSSTLHPHLITCLPPTLPTTHHHTHEAVALVSPTQGLSVPRRRRTRQPTFSATSG